MNLYLDSSALVKRYLKESGSDLVREAMERASRWLVCRIAYAETMTAIVRDAGHRSPAVGAFRNEWPRFAVVEVDQDLVERASDLAMGDQLRTLDALHMASALRIPTSGSAVATWDRRLWLAAKAHGLAVLPDLL